MTDIASDVPVKNLNELTDVTKSKRLAELCDTFWKNYGRKPEFLVIVPGRVNLIGEHVDYCGYPVLPMAIEQNICVAAAACDDDILDLTNTNPKYSQYQSTIHSFKIKVEKGVSPEWHNYFLCGVQGILEKLPNNNKKTGMIATISGNIPLASGLSSSSALVSAATLTTGYIHKFTLNKEELSTISADCERYIGTQGGGMDQAIAFLATEGSAQFIEWNPLRATPTTLPLNSYFVIANSLTRANKAATSDFNQRVIECRLGCRIIAKKLNLPWQNIEKFASLQSELNATLSEMETFVNQILGNDIYSRDDIINLLEINEDELEEKYLTSNTKHLEKFKLRQRALHVIQESIRVVQFQKVAGSETKAAMQELSELLRESHRSLQTLYECSHPNLDRLVQISDEFGIGARLTGAGWGGCIVALCDSLHESTTYINELKEKYYKTIPEFQEEDAGNIVFVTSPQRGAEIYLTN